ncbi:MAG: hypothetical protein NTY07_13145 [Bacteroidia bacterium]|nr:hypothetical protein [Bacteroidia bacterium]
MKYNKLTKEELLLIDGGKISKDTSFVYDIFWGISWVAREVWDGLTSESRDNSYVNAKVGSY